jgi:hypothetical protein
MWHILILDSDSADFQFVLNFHSRIPLAPYTQLLYEFNILPMGLSVGCQGSNRLVETLFSELKLKYFLQLYGRPVYTYTHLPNSHLREVCHHLLTSEFHIQQE